MQPPPPAARIAWSPRAAGSALHLCSPSCMEQTALFQRLSNCLTDIYLLQKQLLCPSSPICCYAVARSSPGYCGGQKGKALLSIPLLPGNPNHNPSFLICYGPRVTQPGGLSPFPLLHAAPSPCSQLQHWMHLAASQPHAVVCPHPRNPLFASTLCPHLVLSVGMP